MLQIFVWTRGSFTLFQTLDFEGDVLSVSPFTREAVPHLLVCVEGQNVSCVLLRWTNRRFQNLQPLKVKGRVIQAEIINTRVDETLLLVVIEGDMSFFFFFLNFLHYNIMWFLFLSLVFFWQLHVCVYIKKINQRN